MGHSRPQVRVHHTERVLLYRKGVYTVGGMREKFTTSQERYLRGRWEVGGRSSKYEDSLKDQLRLLSLRM